MPRAHVELSILLVKPCQTAPSCRVAECSQEACGPAGLIPSRLSEQCTFKLSKMSLGGQAVKLGAEEARGLSCTTPWPWSRHRCARCSVRGPQKSSAGWRRRHAVQQQLPMNSLRPVAITGRASVYAAAWPRLVRFRPLPPAQGQPKTAHSSLDYMPPSTSHSRVLRCLPRLKRRRWPLKHHPPAAHLLLLLLPLPLWHAAQGGVERGQARRHLQVRGGVHQGGARAAGA